MTDPIRIIVQRNFNFAVIPVFSHATDACADLSTPTSLRIAPGETITVDLGIAIQIPSGYEGLIRGRSGLSRRGVHVHYGTVDESYRQNIHVMMRNDGSRSVGFLAGDRIAQLAIRRVPSVDYVEGCVEPTDRGGLGSTGLGAMA